MIIRNSEIKKIMDHRELLGFSQRKIADIFGKTKAWWSKKEVQCEKGIEQEIEASIDQLRELNSLLKFREEDGLSGERDPMVFDETYLIEAAFQDAQERDSLFTSHMLEYICKASETDLVRLRYALYNFKSEFSSYHESPLLTLIVQIREEFTRALKEKFPNDDSLIEFFEIYEEEARLREENITFVKKIEHAYSSKIEAKEYISNFLITKSSKLAFEALKEILLKDFESSLNSAVHNYIHRHFEQRSHL